MAEHSEGETWRPVESTVNPPDGFGPPLRTFRPAPRAIVGAIVAGSVPLILFVLLIAYDFRRNRDFGLIEGLLLLVVGIAFGLTARMIGVRDLVCPEGVVQSRRGKSESCRWDDVSEFLEQERRGGTFVTVTRRTCVLKTHDGRRLVLSGDEIGQFDELLSLLRAEAARRGLRWTCREVDLLK